MKWGIRFSSSRAAAVSRALQPIALLSLDRGIRTMELDSLLAVEPVVVHADHDPPAGVHLLLIAERGIGDLALREPALDRLDHPPELVDAREVLVGGALHLIRH